MKSVSNTSSVFKALVLARSGCRRATKTAMLISAVVGLSACSIIPGTSAMSMRVTEESAVKLPVVRNQEAVPENVAVKQITAELVIEQLKSGQVQFRTGALGGQTAAVRSAPPDFGLQNADYKLGPGDVINVTVWDHPELTIPAGSYRSAESSGTLISDDGSIFYPYVGTMKVAGLSVRELRDVLAKRLSKVIERVQLDVRVVVFRSKRVYIVGEVKNPGLQAINDIPMTVLEAVSRAGGFSDEADHGNVLLTRSGKTYRVDVQALYEDGDVSQNVLLQPGDIVNVPDRQLNKIFVLGEVTKPGSYIMNKRRSTLAEALSDAGFLNAYTSAANWIYVMRSGEGKPELFHLNAGSPDALLLAERFPLLPRDVVYVDVSDLARWNRVVANILPTTTLLNSINAIQFPLLSNSRNGTSVISVPSTPAQ
ncbi:polysaccharide export protein [Zoogloea sp.]|uniref:polysaccharide export protein n=1 Tax=Zoogloea sp. TaxID=49181 RepID=UPI003459DAF5